MTMTTRKLAIVALAALAAATSRPAAAREVSIGTHEAEAGNVVVVPLVLDNGTNLASAHLQVNYDPNLLSVTAATNPSGTIAYGFDLIHTNDDGTVNIVIATDTPSQAPGGTLLYISFLVNAGAEPGMNSPLVIARRDLGGDYGADLETTHEVTHSNGHFWVVLSASVDTDGDGLSDYDEQMFDGEYGYDPGRSDPDILKADTDGDGMPDGWEAQNSLNPVSDDAWNDYDGDRLPNYHEWIAGTQPTNSGDCFEITDIATETNFAEIVITWSAVSNHWYSVYSRTNLLDVGWLTNLYRRKSVSDGPMSYTNSEGPPLLFFRLAVENE